jgi:hypothetical protein
MQSHFWYQKYVEVLQNLGWAAEQFVFMQFEHGDGPLRMDQAALGIEAAIATQQQLRSLEQSVAALAKLAQDEIPMALFDFHASNGASGNFQLGAVERTPNGALALAVGGFHFHRGDERKRFLFRRFGAGQVNLWTSAQRMVRNADLYARRRSDVIAKLHADAAQYVADLD